MLKPRSFRGRCPLDPRRGSAPGPCQGPLDPTPLDAPLASLAPLSWIQNFYPWLAAPILNSFRRAWSLSIRWWHSADLVIHRFKVLLILLFNMANKRTMMDFFGAKKWKMTTESSKEIKLNRGTMEVSLLRVVGLVVMEVSLKKWKLTGNLTPTRWIILARVQWRWSVWRKKWDVNTVALSQN